MLHGHGDNGYLYPQDIRADFSTNVWYGGEPVGLKEHLFGQWERINRYPQVLAESLGRRIATHHGLPPENILVCSGATEGIYLAAQALKPAKTGSGAEIPTTAIVVPAFAEYEDACRVNGHDLRFIGWDALAGTNNDRLAGTDKDRLAGAVLPGMLWIGQPNNPTGEIFPQLESLIRQNPETLFVVDEAFVEFTSPSSSLISSGLPNLVVLRSLTKAFAIPGLRLGYIAAPEAIIRRLKAFKQPWTVNAMAAEAGNYIFDNYTALPIDRLLKDKAAFVRDLEDLGITVYPGSTHFFLCETPKGTAAELQRYLLDHHRLLIRDAGNFRGLGDRHFRLATLEPGKNQLLTKAVKEWQAS